MNYEARAQKIRIKKVYAHKHFVMDAVTRRSNHYPDANYLNESTTLLGVMDMADKDRCSLEAFKKAWIYQQIKL